ncbi:MAG TPA: tRNA lysidine(34) synthetase TilS [Gammaproteobacteria bacterium]|nr:tRNA lysidine(34) synthetase TilS [Gammaproteobacteria bacterium]
MSFVKRFQTALESLSIPPETMCYVIAYSGGVDSHVLLHCCRQLDLPVRAVHVHHGLQSVADDWVKHCQQVCESLGIPLDTLYVDARQKQGESPEQTARNVRYEALKNNLVTGDCLLTGQHLNDQAETLLLQLFRAASAAGLAAMPACRLLGEYIHLRPLLTFSRVEIETFARHNALDWIEDPSNQDTAFDRNFLRKTIFPALEQRWPEIITQLSTVARQQSANLTVQEDMAAIDLANVTVMPERLSGGYVFQVMSMLSLQKLRHLSSPRLLNMLRYWIMVTLEKQPTRNLLEELENALINSRQDASPDIAFSGYTFKKFQGNLYLIRQDDKHEVQDALYWRPSSSLVLPGLNIQLDVLMPVAGGLNKKLLDESLHVCFRQGGEKFHPAGRQHSRSLKKLFQEAEVPPWERDVIPLVYSGDELIAVGGLWLAKGAVVDEGEHGWRVEITNV